MWLCCSNSKVAKKVDNRLEFSSCGVSSQKQERAQRVWRAEATRCACLGVYSAGADIG